MPAPSTTARVPGKPVPIAQAMDASDPWPFINVPAN